MGPLISKAFDTPQPSPTKMQAEIDVLKQELSQAKKEQEGMIEKMALLLMMLMRKKSEDKVVDHINMQIEIDGVRYQVNDAVERGGFGIVYKAKGPDDRIIAVKFMQLFKDSEDQIRNEIRFMRTVHKIKIKNHPIIEYYGSEKTTKGLCIAMELADCDLMSFWMQRVDQSPANEKFIMGILIFMFVLRALIFLEKLGIVHGDIKPNNLVIVEKDGNFCIKLIDFGTVEKLDTKRSMITVDKGKAHTRMFVSPEFLKRDLNGRKTRVLHKKSDAWAAGTMFYFLLFGKMPWKDDEEYDDFVNDPNAEDVPVPEKDKCEIIIKLLMKKNPLDRSTAKKALESMKQEEMLGAVVKKFEEKFGPADDVCSLIVPEEIRAELKSRPI